MFAPHFIRPKGVCIRSHVCRRFIWCVRLNMYPVLDNGQGFLSFHFGMHYALCSNTLGEHSSAKGTIVMQEPPCVWSSIPCNVFSMLPVFRCSPVAMLAFRHPDCQHCRPIDTRNHEEYHVGRQGAFWCSSEDQWGVGGWSSTRRQPCLLESDWSELRSNGAFFFLPKRMNTTALRASKGTHRVKYTPDAERRIVFVCKSIQREINHQSMWSCRSTFSLEQFAC